MAHHHRQIGEVAERTGLSLRTIRYYEEVGLITPSARSQGGFRLYTEEDIARLGVVKAMKPLDFPSTKCVGSSSHSMRCPMTPPTQPGVVKHWSNWTCSRVQLKSGAVHFDANSVSLRVSPTNSARYPLNTRQRTHQRDIERFSPHHPRRNRASAFHRRDLSP